jgi:hypothetical protein
MLVADPCGADAVRYGRGGDLAQWLSGPRGGARGMGSRASVRYARAGVRRHVRPLLPWNQINVRRRVLWHRAPRPVASSSRTPWPTPATRGHHGNGKAMHVPLAS